MQIVVFVLVLALVAAIRLGKLKTIFNKLLSSYCSLLPNTETLRPPKN